MMNVLEFAKRELDIAGGLENGKESCERNARAREYIMDLLGVIERYPGFLFDDESVCQNLFMKLANYDIITPLRGCDDEWGGKCGGEDIGSDQNNRDTSVFRHKTHTGDFIYTYQNAVKFIDKNGKIFTGTVKLNDGTALSYHCCAIKTFPFTPKTFYVDVVDTLDYSIKKVKDESQLVEPFKYYDNINYAKVVWG